jgi:nucleotide-binding universal stress UspA family protein
MNAFQRIVFPVDFSPGCEATVPFVKEMVRKNNAALSLLHVVEFPFYAYGGVMTESPVAWESFEENYRTGLQNLSNFACLHFGDLVKTTDVGTVCDRGDPGYAILALAEKSEADLIMMPTHGEGAFRSFLVGSATVRVLHRAPCAVWTGAHLESGSASAHPDVKRILCALDLERESAHVLARALQLAETFSAEVSLVHCVPVPEAVPAEDFLSEFDRFLADSAREKIAKIQADAGTDLALFLKGGRIAAVVRDAALQQGADLIVIGRGHTHAPFSRLRTNAYAIVREAPCPVLSL